jgi:hypothetical protein
VDGCHHAAVTMLASMLLLSSKSANRSVRIASNDNVETR